MSMSGITVDDDCVQKFEELKLKKKHQYIIFRISADFKCIEVESVGEKGETFDDFKAKITQAKEARYAVLDYSTKKGGIDGNVGFVYWVHDECSVRYKMTYASSKDALKKKLTGIQDEWPIYGIQDFVEEDVPEKMKKKANS
ncbi:putative ferric reductase transmembrane component [Mactra antiquata]